ncbi:MAG: hypothetical protein KC506_03980, partial [Nanoarchaeota archaeon]|nr:hypothetical protein [Nanoarchaeota archaeon]
TQYSDKENGQVQIILSLDIKNVLRETSSTLEPEIIGYVEKLQNNKITFENKGTYQIPGEALKHVNQLKDIPFPINMEIFESDERNLEEVTTENGINQEIKITQDYAAKKTESESNKITYRIYFRGEQTPITMLIEKEIYDFSAQDIINSQDPENLGTTKISSVISFQTSVIKTGESLPIPIGESEQEIIDKVSAWRNEVFNKTIKIEYNYKPDENTNEKMSNNYCTELVKERIVVDLTKPKTSC